MSIIKILANKFILLQTQIWTKEEAELRQGKVKEQVKANMGRDLSSDNFKLKR